MGPYVEGVRRCLERVCVCVFLVACGGKRVVTRNGEVR